ncbi:MAG: hypothetical protein ACHQ53_11585 [Polyangiales bacterium]
MRLPLGLVALLLAVSCATRATQPELAPSGQDDAGSGGGSHPVSGGGSTGSAKDGSAAKPGTDAAVACNSSCDDGVACTDDACDSGSGQCLHVPNHAKCNDAAAMFCDRTHGCSVVHCTTNADCDDGSRCNGSEECVGGQCFAGTAPMIDDGIACTRDSCAEPGVITHAADDTKCDDGKVCNGQEHCDPKTGCKPGTAPGLDDGVDCTVDACDESTHAVTHTPTDSKCDDGDVCTRDRCATTGCTHPHDGDACPCTPGGSCDPFGAMTCGAAETCRATTSGSMCQTLSSPTLAAGAACLATADQFACAAGTLCADFGDGPKCRTMCRKDTIGKCPSGQACTGAISGEACVQVCQPVPLPCDPVAQDCASTSDTCTFASNPETGEPYMGCRPIGTRTLGQTCGGNNGSCGHDQVCVATSGTSICRQLCDSTAKSNACTETGKTCTGSSTLYQISFCQ